MNQKLRHAAPAQSSGIEGIRTLFPNFSAFHWLAAAGRCEEKRLWQRNLQIKQCR